MLSKEAFFGMYLEQKVQFADEPINTSGIPTKYIGTLYSVDNANCEIYVEKDNANFEKYLHLDSVKLILRPLEDMTGEENKEYNKIHNQQDKTFLSIYSEIIEWAIEKGFDIFDGHSRGWVVYRKEIE